MECKGRAEFRRWPWICNVTATIGCLCVPLGCSDRAATNQGLAVSSGASETANDPAPSKSDPDEIIRRAIAAFGGDSARNKLRTCKTTTRVVMRFPAAARELGDDTTLVEDTCCYPDKWRRTVRRNRDGTMIMLCVVNGNDCWVKSAGEKVHQVPLPPGTARTPALIATLDQLYELQEAKEAVVAGENEQEQDRTLVPLTILKNGRPTVTTYFERSTGLVAKSTKYSLPDLQSPPKTWKDKSWPESETTYQDYKSFDGVTIPTRVAVTQAGKAVMEFSVVAVEFPATFDSDTFAKPRDD